jgi:SNF2 family DNA or RNA helicase
MHSLYSYQRDGADWLARTPRALLADDPGLGKTATVLTAAAKAQAHRLLVICPTCVLWNWQREVDKWAPYRRVQVIDKGSTELDPEADTVVVTHGLLLSDALRERLIAAHWDAVVLDESHFFRTRTAKRARHFYGEVAPKVERVWLLSATPMPNDASELWTMAVGLGKTARSFHSWRSHYCATAWSPYGDHVKVVGNRNADELRNEIAPWVLRRRKADVLRDLPPRRFETVALRCEKMPHEIELLTDEIPSDLVRALRDESTAEQAFEVLGSSREFAAFRRLCGLAKAGAVADLLAVELDSGLHKVVVMAHHGDVVHYIAQRLAKFGAVIVTGATSAGARRAAVDEFQRGDARVFVGNIVAAGTGVTLTAASELVFAEMSYVPGENVQAADRIHRIGQRDSCRVRFVSLDGTLDESLVGVLSRKTQMIREVLDR